MNTRNTVITPEELVEIERWYKELMGEKPLFGFTPNFQMALTYIRHLLDENKRLRIAIEEKEDIPEHELVGDGNYS